MINVNVNGDLISGSYGKEQFVVSFTQERYDAMMALKAKADTADSIETLQMIFGEFASLTKEDYKSVIETACPYLVVNPTTEEFFLTANGVISSIPIPFAITSRILDSVEKGIDFMPLVKLWTRFLRNPKLRSLSKNERNEFANRFANYIDKDYVNTEKVTKLMEEQGLAEDIAIKYASVKDVSITQEGLLCTHKVVDEITTKWELDADGNAKRVDRYKKTIDPDTGLIKTELPSTNEERLFEPAVMHQGGDAFYCEGPNGYTDKVHFVKVGCIIRLPDWSFVNTDDNVSCVRG